MKLFPEEQVVLDKLLQEWYDSIKEFTKQADGIFSERAQQYDRIEPAWESLNFPHGFQHEIRKKIGRVKSALTTYPDSDLDLIAEELRDIVNYARMCGALVLMVQKREDTPHTHTAVDEIVDPRPSGPEAREAERRAVWQAEDAAERLRRQSHET